MQTTEGAEKPRLPLDTNLAIARTRLAFERTLMAWVRTAASLVTFGFTLFKAFDYLRSHEKGPARETSWMGHLGAREFGVALIAVGLIALVLAQIQFSHHVKALPKTAGEPPVFSIATVVSILFVVLGGLALASIFLG